MVHSIILWLRTGKVAQWLGYILRPQLVALFARLFNQHGTIRIVNYHDVAPDEIAQFEKHLEFFQRNFYKVSMDDFENFLNGTMTKHNKPGLLLSFDDGLRSHFEVVAPLLQKWGFSGLFLVPSEFLQVPRDEQMKYIERHRIDSKAITHKYPDGRVSMTIDEVRLLAKTHGVVCHTHSHRRLGRGISLSAAEYEIKHSKETLERMTGVEIKGFGWVGGELLSYSAEAASIIKRLKFRYALITKAGLNNKKTRRLELRRSSLDAFWPVSLVSFHLCGLFDLLYWSQKLKISRVYKTSSEVNML